METSPKPNARPSAAPSAAPSRGSSVEPSMDSSGEPREEPSDHPNPQSPSGAKHMISHLGKALYFREGVDLAQFHHKVWPRVNIRVSGSIQGAAARHILSTLIMTCLLVRRGPFRLPAQGQASRAIPILDWFHVFPGALPG